VIDLLRSARSLIQKTAIVGYVILLFLCVFVVGGPISVAAEEPNVVDWLNEEQPTSDQPDKFEVETGLEPNTVQEKSPMLLIGQLIFYTLLIVAMIYALIKFLASRQKKLQPNQAIHLIGGTPIGNNKSLQLVKVGGKVYLLGVADQITLIKEFASEDEIGIDDGDQRKSASFSSSLLGLAKKQPAPQPNRHFEQLFHQSLKKQKEKQGQLAQDLVENDQEGRER